MYRKGITLLSVVSAVAQVSFLLNAAAAPAPATTRECIGGTDDRTHEPSPKNSLWHIFIPALRIIKGILLSVSHTHLLSLSLSLSLAYTHAECIKQT